MRSGGTLLRAAGGETRTAWSGDFMFSFRGLSYVDQSPWDWVVWSDEAPAPLHPSENGREAACTAMWLDCSRKTSLKVTGTSLTTWSCLKSLGNHLYLLSCLCETSLLTNTSGRGWFQDAAVMLLNASSLSFCHTEGEWWDAGLDAASRGIRELVTDV